MKIFLTLLLITAFLGIATRVSSAQNESATSDLVADVVETRLAHPCYQTGSSNSCIEVLDIKAVIDGRTFWLEASKAKHGLLELGKYNVRLSKDEHPASSKFWRTYTFVYPGGGTEDFGVIGETR